MRLRKAQRAYGYEINIAPLIDVVFLLIIFFMTVSQITRVEVTPLELPQAKTSEPPRMGRLVINVREDGRISCEGRAYTLESLQAMLTAGAAQRKPGDVSVLIRGDRRLPWATAARILQACAAGRIDRVHIAVVEPDQP